MTGCGSAGSRQADDEASLLLPGLARSVASVVAADSERPIAAGAVVRATFESVVVLAALPPGSPAPEPLRVSLGPDAPSPARVLGRDGPWVALEVAREGRDLRPLELAADAPAAGAPLAVVLAPARRGAPLEIVRTGVASDLPRGVAASAGISWLSAISPAGEDDPSSPDARAARAVGGLVLGRLGRVVAAVVGADETSPRVAAAGPEATRLLDAILAPPGADLVRPGDGFLEYLVHLDSIADLPRCEKEEGAGPMLVLEVRVAGELAGRLEVTPGREQREARVRCRAPGPVEIGLVALDRSLARGETREELARPASVSSLAGPASVRLELAPEALAHHPAAVAGPRVAHALLTFTPLDPDRASGARRWPSGATALALGRLTEGRLDLAHGAATEFLGLECDSAVPVAVLVYRRGLGARLELRAFSPGFETELVAVRTEEGAPRLAVATGVLPRGRTLLRLRQVGGSEGTAYEVIVAQRTDAAGLVTPLFRLVSREASREGTAFLDTDPFVDEVAAAIEAVGFPPDTVARALLDQLGDRVLVARRLAFLLLERHFPPGKQMLDERLLQGGEGADDAGLILAEIDPRAMRLRPVVRRAAADPDPYVRARAARVAARSDDPDFAGELADLLARDRTPVVERAVAVARIAAGRGSTRPR